MTPFWGFPWVGLPICHVLFDQSVNRYNQPIDLIDTQSLRWAIYTTDPVTRCTGYTTDPVTHCTGYTMDPVTPCTGYTTDPVTHCTGYTTDHVNHGTGYTTDLVTHYALAILEIPFMIKYIIFSLCICETFIVNGVHDFGQGGHVHCRPFLVIESAASQLVRECSSVVEQGHGFKLCSSPGSSSRKFTFYLLPSQSVKV